MLIAWLGDVCRSAEFPALSQWHAKLAAGLFCLNKFLQLLKEEPVFMSPAQAGVAGTMLAEFLLVLSWLSRDALEHEEMLFPLQPKSHLLAHTSLDIQKASAHRHQVLSPLVCACWMDEDHVGKLARLSRRTHPASYHLRALQRYLLQLRKSWRRSPPGT